MEVTDCQLHWIARCVVVDAVDPQERSSVAQLEALCYLVFCTTESDALLGFVNRCLERPVQQADDGDWLTVPGLVSSDTSPSRLWASSGRQTVVCENGSPWWTRTKDAETTRSSRSRSLPAHAGSTIDAKRRST